MGGNPYPANRCLICVLVMLGYVPLLVEKPRNMPDSPAVCFSQWRLRFRANYDPGRITRIMLPD